MALQARPPGPLHTCARTQIVDEIKERREFLEAMQRAGKGAAYEDTVRALRGGGGVAALQPRHTSRLLTQAVPKTPTASADACALSSLRSGAS